MRGISAKIPGVAACAAIAVPAAMLGRMFDVVGGPVFAILIGMAASLVWRDKTAARAGIDFTSKKILQLAVVLLGFGMDLGSVWAVGSRSLPVIASTISASLITAYAMYKITRSDANVTTLIGVGSSICGGSAVAAAAPVIGARDDEIAQAISVIFLFNVAAALVFPSLGVSLGMTDAGFGLFAGTAVNDTSSVTAAAAAWDGMHGGDSLDTAAIVKMTRTLAIIPITFVLAMIRARRDIGASGVRIAKIFPWFVLFFLVASMVRTFAPLPSGAASFLKGASKDLVIMAMAAVGLNTNIIKLVRSGGRPIAVGASCWVVIACVSLAVQSRMGIW